jgi:hypothetical protein
VSALLTREFLVNIDPRHKENIKQDIFEPMWIFYKTNQLSVKLKCTSSGVGGHF